MTQNRRTRRSNVLMAATLEVSGNTLAVKLRNLSPEGALVEGDKIPLEGSEILFRKGDLTVSGRVAWSEGKRAGIAFHMQLPPDQVLRHIPAPRERVARTFRRPGFGARGLSPEERQFAEQWVWDRPMDGPSD